MEMTRKEENTAILPHEEKNKKNAQSIEKRGAFVYNI